MNMRNTSSSTVVAIAIALGMASCNPDAMQIGIDDSSPGPDAGNTPGSGPAGTGATGTVAVPGSVSCSITEFDVPTPRSGPGVIAPGSDGNLWFTEYDGGKIGQITPAGEVTEYDLKGMFGEAEAHPRAIVPGPDGSMWFTGSGLDASANGTPWIGRITTSGERTKFEVLPAGATNPQGIAPGPDGNLWFTDESGSVGRITTTGKVTMFIDPSWDRFAGSPRCPTNIVAGPDRSLWFVETYQGKIGTISLQGNVREFPILAPTSSYVVGIALGPDANLWYTTALLSVGRMTTKGQATEFIIPTANHNANGIVAGPDGNLWFAETAGNRLAYVTTDGQITECPQLPTPNSYPNALTVGPDGNIWFTEMYANKIGHTNPK
jgi:streptogramin lyase